MPKAEGVQLIELIKNFKTNRDQSTQTSICNSFYNLGKQIAKFYKKRDEKYHLFISTGTPHNEIKKILKIKKIFKYFKGIYGSPDNKIQHIKKILKADKNAIFIGDSMEDYKSAKYMNINFILKVHKENKNILRGKNIFKIKNYKNFNKILNNFYNDY